MRNASIFVGVAVLASLATAAAHPVRIQPSACSAVPARFNPIGRKLIGVDWSHYQPFMKLCPVNDPSGKTILRILALNLPAAQKAGSLEWVNGKRWTPDSPENSDPVPLPILINRNGKPLATLPENLFPLIPNRGYIAATHWHHHFPTQLIVAQDEPNLGPNAPLHCITYRWNPRTQRYAATPNAP
jgi:hypothetical protein